MYIGKEKEQLISSDYILSYFKNKDRKLYKSYVWRQALVKEWLII